MPLLNRAAVIIVGIASLGLSGCGWFVSTDSLLARAQQHREKGDHKAAIIDLKSLLQKNPDHGEGRFLLGLSLNDAGDFLSAEKELKKAKELNVEPVRVLPPYGRALLKSGKFSEVLEEITLGENGPATAAVQADILTIRGRALLALGRKNESSDLFAKALSKQPESADALLGQALVAISDRQNDEAMKLIERAAASAPGNIDVWLVKGDMLRALGDLPKALSAYKKALELNKDNIPARTAIVQVHLASGALREARAELDQLRKLAPGLPMAKLLLAQIEFQEKRYPAARDAILDTLKAAPNYVPAVFLAGAIEHALGSHVQAQAHLSKVVNAIPTHIPAQKILITSLAMSGQVPRALEALNKALKLAPEDSALLLTAGELHLRINEHAKAMDYFERVAKLDPNNAGARAGLGLSRFVGGEAARGLADLEHATRLDPESYAADILLVTLHLQKQSYDQAAKFHQSLERKQPNNPATHHLKAMIALGKQDLSGARRSLGRALELDAKYEVAVIDLARLDLREKNPKAARSRLEAYLQANGSNASVLLALANLGPYLDAKPSDVIAWLERARKADPKSVQPPLMLAEIYVRGGDPTRGLDIARQAEVAFPDNPVVLEKLGAIQLIAGSKQQALRTFERLVSLNPQSAPNLVKLAHAQAVNDNRENAMTTLRKALSMQPNLVEAHLAVANLDLKAGRYGAAVGVAEQLQRRYPKSSVGYVLKGDVLMAERKFRLAGDVYAAGYELDKNELAALKFQHAYGQANLAKDGLDRLQRWLGERPGDITLRQLAGEVGYKMGDFRTAIEHYEWLSKNGFENEITLNNLALAYHKIGDPRAVGVAERAHALHPGHPGVGDTLGFILTERGEVTRSIPILEKASALAPKNIEIRIHLAQALAKSGQSKKARQLVMDAVQAEPKLEQAAEVKSLLEATKP